VFNNTVKKVSLSPIAENNKTNYEALNEQTNKILKGACYINRLLVDEQRGRITGGKRNVKVSLIVAANERANPTEQNDVKREQYEKLLKEYALKNEHNFKAILIKITNANAIPVIQVFIFKKMQGFVFLYLVGKPDTRLYCRYKCKQC